jgi:hypothetical protein
VLERISGIYAISIIKKWKKKGKTSPVDLVGF